MRQYEVDGIFNTLITPIEQEREQAKKEGFRESRPIPEGLIPNGLALGHIALRGDFEPLQPDRSIEIDDR